MILMKETFLPLDAGGSDSFFFAEEVSGSFFFAEDVSASEEVLRDAVIGFWGEVRDSI